LLFIQNRSRFFCLTPSAYLCYYLHMNSNRISNKEVVSILKEVLAAMDVKNFNVFRVRAYQNAIAILDNLTVSIYDLWENGRLKEIPGIGASIYAHLNELFSEGKVKEFEAIKKDLPEGMFALIGIRGIGARKAFKLANAFKIKTREGAVEEIKEHAEKGEIRELEGFGEKSEKDILESIGQFKMTKNEKQRILYSKAEETVARIYDYMKELDCVEHIEAAGSFRRKNATIGDLDIPVSTIDSDKTIKHFLKFPEIAETLVKGDKKCSVVLKNELQVDLRVSTPEAYGAMLQYFTGSKQHNILLRNFSLSKRMSLSEYGIKKGSDTHEFPDEPSFYKFLGLPYIEPELRNGSNEIEAAMAGKLPELVDLKDIKGEVHTHTTDSDGVNTLEEMVEAAIALGYEYLGISDHAPSVTSRGYKEVTDIIKKKRAAINKLNEKQNFIKVFFGYEVNILADATLGLPDEVLSELDYVVASIHTSFNQDREQITDRLLAAIENPYVNIIGHPSGRLLNQRDPVDPAWDKVFLAARDNNKILEINSQPDRLDLTDDLVKEAISWKVKMVISSDAHSTDQLSFMKYGIYNARRGWAERKNIVNALGFDDFVKDAGIRLK